MAAPTARSLPGPAARRSVIFGARTVVQQTDRLGRLRRRLFCSRVPPVSPCDDDGCPICFEPFETPVGWRLPWASGHATEHCRWGCGRAVHSECMKSWIANASDGVGGGCPLCRAQWH